MKSNASISKIPTIANQRIVIFTPRYIKQILPIYSVKAVKTSPIKSYEPSLLSSIA